VSFAKWVLAWSVAGRPDARHTLQLTGLVHEAWLRLVSGKSQSFQNRQHFFAAAAQAMRRILIEKARRKKRERQGGQLQRVELDAIELAAPLPDDDLLAPVNRLLVVEQDHVPIIALSFSERGGAGTVNLGALSISWPVGPGSPKASVSKRSRPR
jgi:DNA-directed RNA polymerase specialized sigma24 family protein